MAVYLVSYDLNRPRGEDAYPDLTGALKRDGAVKVLFSEWLVKSTLSVLDVAKRYAAHIDDNDRLFVCEVLSQRWAKYNLMNPTQSTAMLP